MRSATVRAEVGRCGAEDGRCGAMYVRCGAEEGRCGGWRVGVACPPVEKRSPYCGPVLPRPKHDPPGS